MCFPVIALGTGCFPDMAALIVLFIIRASLRLMAMFTMRAYGGGSSKVALDVENSRIQTRFIPSTASIRRLLSAWRRRDAVSWALAITVCLVLTRGLCASSYSPLCSKVIPTGTLKCKFLPVHSLPFCHFLSPCVAR